MSYRIHIKKDYKPEIRWHPAKPWYHRHRPWLFALGSSCLGSLLYITVLMQTNRVDAGQDFDLLNSPAPINASFPAGNAQTFDETSMGNNETQAAASAAKSLQADDQTVAWQTVKIHRGDNLSLVFDRLGLRPAVLQQIMAAGENTKMLTHLIPDNNLHFQIDKDKLLALKYEPDVTTTLQINKQGDGFDSQITITELDRRITKAEAVIKNSLFLAGQSAGLSDNLIMRLIAIYAWDIDFALNIRQGDSFKIVYEEQFKDGIKVRDGPILAAEFINRNKSYRAVRYTSVNGDTNYFNEAGISMRKAFLRTPVKFNRISSRFNLRRKHPVLNRIRAHKGVDYSAPAGTPIKATGDGVVAYVGRKGGYGKTVILKHGGIYKTVYAHMSRYAKGIKRGKHIKQGKIIGYVGQTGLATGPHLHYEFRLHDVHRNPLTVKLPKASSIPSKHKDHFRAQTAPLLARLDKPGQIEIALQQIPAANNIVMAQQQASTPSTSQN
ncbi:MAG: peptidoglycan DD-metalloendopeptidase family protein [Proteobacteria bacterium]|nr:peptidoglycan DD-metalloendopeptidase family protein [Pseudomonadota bacterium]